MADTGRPGRRPSAAGETPVGTPVVRRRKSDVVKLPEAGTTSRFGESVTRDTLDWGGAAPTPRTADPEDTITILDETRRKRRALGATGAFKPFMDTTPNTDRLKSESGSISIDQPLTKADAESCLTAIEHVRLALESSGFEAEIKSLDDIQNYVTTATAQAMLAARALDEAGDGLEAALESATRDGLTGILNRRGFEVAAAGLLNRCRRNGKPFSVIMFDGDRFKIVNDTFGHEGGDVVLRELARVVGQTLDSPIMARGFGGGVEYVFGRYGGEEFIIACNLRAQDAAVAAEFLRDKIANNRIIFEGRQIPVTASFGVSENSNNEDLVGVRVAADYALYNSKNSGRNRVSVSMYDPQSESSQVLPYEAFKASRERDFTA